MRNLEINMQKGGASVSVLTTAQELIDAGVKLDTEVLNEMFNDATAMEQEDKYKQPETMLTREEFIYAVFKLDAVQDLGFVNSDFELMAQVDGMWEPCIQDMDNTLDEQNNIDKAVKYFKENVPGLEDMISVLTKNLENELVIFKSPEEEEAIEDARLESVKEAFNKEYNSKENTTTLEDLEWEDVNNVKGYPFYKDEYDYSTIYRVPVSLGELKSFGMEDSSLVIDGCANNPLDTAQIDDKDLAVVVFNVRIPEDYDIHIEVVENFKPEIITEVIVKIEDEWVYADDISLHNKKAFNKDYEVKLLDSFDFDPILVDDLEKTKDRLISQLPDFDKRYDHYSNYGGYGFSNENVDQMMDDDEKSYDRER